MQRYFIKLSPACVVDSSTQQDILFRVSKDIQKRSSGLPSDNNRKHVFLCKALPGYTLSEVKRGT